MPGAPLPDGQLTRPEAVAARAAEAPTPAPAELRQGVPRSPEEAFGIGLQANIDQTYLDDLEQAKPRRMVWLGVALGAVAAAIAVAVVVTRTPDKKQPPPLAAVAPPTSPEPAPAPTPAVVTPEAPLPVPPAPEAPAPTPEATPPKVASPQPEAVPEPELAVTPPAKTKSKGDAGSDAPAAAEELDPAKLLARANALYQKGKLKAAITEYKKLVELDETNDRAHTGLGTAYFDTDQNALAIQHLRRALELNAKNGQALVILGNVHQAMGDNPKAKQAYEQYLQIEPSGKFAADVRLILQSM
jgi:type IV secretory pathway VirB10-like protein